MERPAMMPQTAELDAAKARGAQLVEACRNSAAVSVDPETITRSGSLVYFTYAGARYSLSTLLCSCPALAVELAADGTPRDYLNATYTCAQHGTHQSVAMICAETSHHQPSQAFAWVEQRHARDRRVAWGMKQSPSSGGMAPRRTP